MKKLIFCLMAVFAIEISAQDIIPYAQCDKNAEATYVVLRGEKRKLNFGVCYYRFTTDNIVEQADGSKVVTYNTALLNKKMKTAATSGMVGTKNGFYSAIKVMPDGSYKMDQDLMWGVAGHDMARGGFMFNIPAKMSVGDKLECGTVRQEYSYDMMGHVKTNFTYSDVQVISEEDLTVNAGTFHCAVIEGKINGTMSMGGSEFPMSKSFKMWLTPGIGVVRYQVTVDVIYNVELYSLTK